ncbi:nucleoside hydrolase [Corynebacterium breve]|uniref:Nucleoside hydrolase n=1 Tax=Corynebacterium breve TaxID=3049799 RepID=A0ABY8VIY5_9CORY|nr:nucleoside hydrolase [Corynebacterium breve]WIM68588.1 nucleoside hydrolase [Corynebacterium breve]
MASKPVLLDCDPGIDDTLALIYLAGLHSLGEIELHAVTTTAGNADVATTARNAAWVLNACGISTIPVVPGEPAPQKVPLVTTPETHGDSGLGYFNAPEHMLGDDYVDLWQRAVDTHGRDLHVIVTGPATNVSAFRSRDPQRFAELVNITVMGGAVNHRGNSTPTAEWNFWVDPHAAADIFDHAPCPITLCSLEVTDQMLVGPERLQDIVDKLGATAIAQYLPEILRFYFEFHQAKGEGYQAQIHDLLTCMIALGTIDFAATATTVAVETESPLLRGTSVADVRGHWGRQPNARLVTSAAIQAAHDEFDRACAALNR